MWISIRQHPPKTGWYLTASRQSIIHNNGYRKRRFWNGEQWMFDTAEGLLPSQINGCDWLWSFR